MGNSTYSRIKEYIGFLGTLIMLCVWIVTILWYGKKIDQNTDAVNKLNSFYEQQLELNGKVIMYIEMSQ